MTEPSTAHATAADGRADAHHAEAGGLEDAMRHDVWAGLQRPQKELSPKYFYDARGSALFDRITELPEYYPTRTERALLEGWGRVWIAALGARAIVELGAGSADKTRVLLDALDPADTLYLPLDISTAYLEDVGSALREEYPGLTVQPVRSDIAHELHVPPDLPAPAVFAFLGGTIGNFYPAAAGRLLARVAAALRAEDRFLLGVDLRKDVAVLEAAYNDAQGVTAEFNLNMLHALNHQIGSNFDVAAFAHHAFYNADAGRIEMHLVARGAQTVHVPGCGDVAVAYGESIRTEISAKYDRPGVERLLAANGLALETWTTDDADFFALVVARATDQRPDPAA